MKKNFLFILSFLLLFIPAFLIFPKNVKADPADVTNVDLFYGGQQKNSLAADIYIPWNEALFVINSDVNATPSAGLFLQNKAKFVSYVAGNLLLTNNGEKCNITGTDIPSVDENELMFGRGLRISSNFNCQSGFTNLIFKNTMFVNDFPMQSNIVNVYEADRSTLIQGSLLTQRNPEMIVGYVKNNGATTAQATAPTTTTSNQGIFIKSLASRLGSTSLLATLLIVFALGFLHTAEAGHSKTILAGALIDKKVDFRQSIAYAAIFTITHISDILLMGVILLIANSFTDVFAKLPYLQVFSLYSLFFISFYLLLKNTTHFFKTRFMKNHDHDHEHGHEHHDHTHEQPKGDFKHQLLMGFIAGIAPCLFGWSIFMIILSTRKVIVIFPVIGAFGLGIFCALLLFAFIIVKLKSKLFEKKSFIGEISPILSSLLLLVYSLLQIL